MKASNKSELIATVGAVLMGIGLAVPDGERFVLAAAITFLWSACVGLFGRDR